MLPQSNSPALIERVTFHSEESGFAVLRVKVEGFRELVTVVGTLPGVNAGEWLDAPGAWVMDRARAAVQGRGTAHDPAGHAGGD